MNKKKILLGAVLAALAGAATAAPNFQRIATFPVLQNLPADRDPSKATVAEIIAASEDGRLLVYTDAEQKGIGFIDILNPVRPQAAGFVALEGESTSVALTRTHALVAVVTSESFVKPSGHVAVVDLQSRKVVAKCELGGQPDSVTLDHTKGTLAVVIENERDEKLNKGAIPQQPSGWLTTFRVKDGAPDCKTRKDVTLAGLAGIAADDAEPEFVKINSKGLAVVSLQENNHFALVDTRSGKVTRHFSAGTVDLKNVDSKRDGVISPTDNLDAVKREPDAVAWLDDKRFVSANEGDYQGGSRSFSIFNVDGSVEYDSGSLLDHIAMQLGHYPEARSAAKGVEPEGVEVARFGDETLIFVGAERASLVFVFRDQGAGKAPLFLQALPGPIAPEGLLAIPSRGLFVTASESDLGPGLVRSMVTIYRRDEGLPSYPTIESVRDAQGLPVTWSALSGLTAGAAPNQLFGISDSAYSQSRIYAIDASATPARINRSIAVTKAGKPFGYDLEGIARRADGGFWLASEGNPELKEPTVNLLIRTNADGAVQDEIALPDNIARHAVRFGFEGVAVTGSGDDEAVWLAVQREWKDDPKGHAKILVYRPALKSWGVLHYPLDAARGKDAWMGLSELTYAGDDNFIVIERDNQFGAGTFKRLYSFSVRGQVPVIPGIGNVPVVKKQLVRDLEPALAAPKGYVLDKLEGFTLDAAGNAFAVTDNDGVDKASGETQFLRLGKLR
ncbi:esterase-like activity of phytase family protein [Uliginosibacterium sp. H1]|uniref:esterase-like activity of phytase family protein n=1 Tax=Uliginosibacterium sp. H1 TaxID=3114757 RepID=UPI002E183778|nr:esterase-like activity of phytase family protein [Uliginosibacterium sp. H1]